MLIAMVKKILFIFSTIVFLGFLGWIVFGSHAVKSSEEGEIVQSGDFEGEDMDILLYADLPEDEDERAEALLQAFKDKRLLEIEQYSIPESDSVIVLASVVLSADVDTVRCGLQDNGVCSLFYRSGDGEDQRLILTGSDMIGFVGIESFLDDHTVIVATSWSLYEYTSIVRKSVDLETGEIEDLLAFDIDQSMEFAEMTITGPDLYFTVTILGDRQDGQLIPNDIVLTKGIERKLIQQMSVAELNVIGESLIELSDEDRVSALFVYPKDTDIETMEIAIDLFGIPYLIDLRTPALMPRVATSI